jgi:phage terminase large subunit-like protein
VGPNPADLRAIESGCYFSLPHALRVRTFFEKFLCIAPKRPFLLYDWQWRCLGSLMGWRNKKGKRRFRQAYIEIPKKNGKSLLISGLMLYMLVGDGKYGAECYNAASDKSQAEQIYKECAKMVANSPILRKRLRVINSTKRILMTGKGGVPTGFIRSLSKDSFNAEGIKAHLLAVDELHVLRDRSMYGSLRFATIAKEDDGSGDTSLMVAITGIVHYEDYFACIYAADADDDIYAEATWYKANPALGLSLDIDEFRQAAQKAKESKSDEILFRRYRLDQWVAGQIDSWVPMKAWMACKPRLSAAELLGKECHAGLDLSSTSDLTALVLAFADGEGGYHLLPFIWCPEDTVIERTQRENVPYQQWVQMGLIETTPGNVVDYDYIRSRIGEIAKLYKIRELAMDRAWQGQALETNLLADGHNVIRFGQGFLDMGPAAKQFEVLVRKGLLRHGDNPVMQWAASNCVAEQDPAGNTKVSKRKSTEKVDPIIASLMAIGRASVGVGVSKYESGDLLVL